MIRRLLRTIFRLVFVVVVLGAALLIYLALTNPKATKSDGWTELAEMPQARGEVAAAVIGDRFVVIGGLRGATTTSDVVSIYDIRRDAWSDGGTFPKLHHAAAAAIGRSVYVSGGARSATDWTPAELLYSFVPGHELRSKIEMPEGRQGHAMVAVGSKLFIVGGVGRTDDTLIHDTKKKQWTTGAALPAGRDHLRAVAWDGKVWALGGRSGDVLSRVDIYDPKKDEWSSGPDLPEPMSAMAVGVIDDELHVIGGEDPDPVNGGVSEKHFVLAEGSERWSEGPKPVLAVHGAGYGVYKDRLIVAAGASRQGAFSTISWTGITQQFGR